jgi:hypothetical protein
MDDLDFAAQGIKEGITVGQKYVENLIKQRENASEYL